VVKRRGIQDDIVGGVRRIVSPWLGAPPTQPRQVTQAQGVARAAAETLDQTVTGGMIKAGVQGNKALVKQAAINAAALGTGYIAGKAVQTAAGAVAKTGVPQRLLNTLTNRTVVLHGTGEILTDVKGIPYKFDSVGRPVNPNASLRPRAGSPALPDTPAVFGWNPKYLDGMGSVENQLQIYSKQQRNFGYAADTPGFVPQNQVVVGTARTKTVRPQGSNDAIQEVLGPVKIKQIVKTDQPLMKYYEELGIAAKRAGAKTAYPDYRDKLERAIKKQIEQINSKRRNPTF